MDSRKMSSSMCGKTVIVKNKSSGATQEATVADTCPTCTNAESLDLSRGLFAALTNSNFGLGMFDIEYAIKN